MQSDDDTKDSKRSQDDSDEKKGEGAIADVMRKIALTGLGAIFMTEETIRQTISEMKLPKEILGKVLANASKGKDELIKALSKEFKQILSNFNLSEEISRYLQKHDVHIDAKVSFSPKKDTKQAE